MTEGEFKGMVLEKLRSIEKRQDDHDKDIDALKRFQVWLTGLAAGLGAVLGLFMDQIKGRIGL